MSQSAAAFSATEAINEGLWDDHLGSLLLAVRHRLALISPNHKPGWDPPKGCVWVWLDGEGGPQWRAMGTGVVLDDATEAEHRARRQRLAVEADAAQRLVGETTDPGWEL